MELKPLGIAGAWVATSPVRADERGSFREWFKSDDILAATGIDFSTGTQKAYFRTGMEFVQ
jgi:dTDP-4-dehydrorhamnose 3,5-epimerase-like enzyme